MKLIELKCKNCNASLEIEDSATSVTCKYCHSKFLVDDEVRATSKLVKDSVDIAKNELKEERKTGLKIGVSIVAIAIIGLVILGGALSRKSLDNKKKINVFDYIEVSYGGNNGDGTMEISIKDNDEGIVLSDFNCKYKNVLLSNNDKVKVACTSNNYLLIENEKTYVVEGLHTYLNDINELDNKLLNDIHDISNIEIDKVVKAMPLKITNYNKKQIKTILISDKNTNKVYDIYEVAIDINNKYAGTIYEVAVINNVIEYDGKINYDSSNNIGTLAKLAGFQVNGYDSLNEAELAIKKAQTSESKISEK